MSGSARRRGPRVESAFASARFARNANATNMSRAREHAPMFVSRGRSFNARTRKDRPRGVLDGPHARVRWSPGRSAPAHSGAAAPRDKNAKPPPRSRNAIATSRNSRGRSKPSNENSSRSRVYSFRSRVWSKRSPPESARLRVCSSRSRVWSGWSREKSTLSSESRIRYSHCRGPGRPRRPPRRRGVISWRHGHRPEIPDLYQFNVSRPEGAACGRRGGLPSARSHPNRDGAVQRD